MVPGPSGSAPIDVVELNPHAPRPFVFTEAALCLRDSLLAAGWTSTHRRNEIDPQAYSIVLGAVPPFPPLVAQLDPRRTFIANFEQLGSASALARGEYEQWLRHWVVVDYHSRNVEYLQRQHPAQRAFEIPLVPAPSVAFDVPAPAERSVDVLFFGSLNERRAALLNQLKAAGLSVEIVAGAYGAELAPAIRRARLVLHIHYYETALFPVVRMLQPVAVGVPVVCETPVFSHLSDWSRSGMVFAPYAGLVDACRELLASPHEQQQRAAQAQSFARTLDFATPFRCAFASLVETSPVPPPSPIAPPVPLSASVADDEDRPLSNEEIEAILLQEGAAPSEGEPAPVQLVMREPGQGRLGRWIVWFLIAFSGWTIWRAMH
jgi:hypothetical protein